MMNCTLIWDFPSWSWKCYPGTAKITLILLCTLLELWYCSWQLCQTSQLPAKLTAGKQQENGLPAASPWFSLVFFLLRHSSCKLWPSNPSQMHLYTFGVFHKGHSLSYKQQKCKSNKKRSKHGSKTLHTSQLRIQFTELQEKVESCPIIPNMVHFTKWRCHFSKWLPPAFRPHSISHCTT